MSFPILQSFWTRPLTKPASARQTTCIQHSSYRTNVADTENLAATKQTESSASSIPTWEDYFRLRKKRRMYELAACVPSTIAPTIGSLSYFAQLEIDPFTTFFGMDPLMFSALATVGAGVGGFMAGPMLGGVLFKVMNRKVMPAMDQRDKDFYEHIKKNRADARLNSIRNPVPDYYGEKILSVSDYRAWLRKQREHYRKGMFGGDASDIQD